VNLAPKSFRPYRYGCDCCRGSGTSYGICSHFSRLLCVRQLCQQTLLCRQVLRHQQRQPFVLLDVAFFCSRLILVVRSETRAVQKSRKSHSSPPPPPLVRFEYPPTVDTAFGQKILQLSCSDNDPGCQKTPYVLRMTFASSLFFGLMCDVCSFFIACFSLYCALLCHGTATAHLFLSFSGLFSPSARI
jgi:hypothetical protein